MMQKLLTLAALAVAALWAAAARADDKDATKDAKDGFVSIFNGKDLTGWEGQDYWTVEDGAITGQSTTQKPARGQSFLFWRGGKPADFELHAKFRFQSPWGNSGINFRSQELPNWDVKGYQADMETGTVCTGTLYECNQRGVMTVRGQKVVIDENGKREATKLADAADLQKHIKPQEWNDYVIIARGPELIFKINGLVMSHVIDHEKGKAAREGVIALQLHPGPPMKVQFKDLEIKTLQ
ncbi:MAG: DUF1080 domain-containing protein [Thermoguttaceae bacterium]